MAKLRKSKKALTKASRRRGKRKQQLPLASSYQALLHDPCTGVLASPYGGERGIVERFVADTNLGTSTTTTGCIFLTPGQNIYGGLISTGSGIAATTTSAAAVAPTFFLNNVRKARCIAACLELIPSSLSITNITGELAMGVFDSTTVVGGVSYTTDALFTLCNDREVIQKRDYELKWFPGSADNLYNGRITGQATLTGAEPASQNQLFIAWRGVPTGTNLSFRMTVVYEWTPEPGLGLAITSSPGVELDWRNQSAALHHADPNWWKSGRPGLATGGQVSAAQMGSFSGRMKYLASQNKGTHDLMSYLSSRDTLFQAFNSLGHLF